MSKTTAQQRRLRARMVRRAIETDVPLLARALHHLAESSGWSWERLAQSLGCTVEDLNGIALCRPPRPECFAEDVRPIAGNRVDPKQLARLLYPLVFPLQDSARAAEARAEYGIAPLPEVEARADAEGEAL